MGDSRLDVLSATGRPRANRLRPESPARWSELAVAGKHTRVRAPVAQNPMMPALRRRPSASAVAVSSLGVCAVSRVALDFSIISAMDEIATHESASSSNAALIELDRATVMRGRRVVLDAVSLRIA